MKQKAGWEFFSARFLLFITAAGNYFAAETKSDSLPDLVALIGRAAHGRTFRNIKSFEEGFHVRERTIDTPHSCGVRVGIDLQFFHFGADIDGPDFGIVEEETLSGSITVDNGTFLAVKRFLISAPRKS